METSIQMTTISPRQTIHPAEKMKNKKLNYLKI